MPDIKQLHQQAIHALNQRDFADAHSLCVQIVKQDPCDHDGYFLLAMINLEVGQIAKAIKLIEKAKNRKPFMSLNQRMEIISEMKCVDMVIPQIDKNKQNIVDKYKIDAIVVGSDWKGKYPKTSCEIIYIEYTKEISSTIIRNKLNHNG